MNNKLIAAMVCLASVAIAAMFQLSEAAALTISTSVVAGIGVIAAYGVAKEEIKSVLAKEKG